MLKARTTYISLALAAASACTILAISFKKGRDSGSPTPVHTLDTNDEPKGTLKGSSLSEQETAGKSDSDPSRLNIATIENVLTNNPAADEADKVEELKASIENVSYGLYQGIPDYSQIMTLAVHLLDRVNVSSQSIGENGEYTYDLLDLPEIGTATLHVYAVPREAQDQYQIKLKLKELSGYTGPQEGRDGGRMSLHFGFGGGERSEFMSAHVDTTLHHTIALRDSLSGSGPVAVGGMYVVYPDKAQWTSQTLEVVTMGEGETGWKSTTTGWVPVNGSLSSGDIDYAQRVLESLRDGPASAAGQ